MRVVLSTYDSRGGVEPLAALAVQLQALGAEVRIGAPPDFEQRLAGVGVPLVPVGPPVRPFVHRAEKLGIPSVYVSYCPISLPSPHHRPQSLPSRPVPPDVTDHQVLDELDAQSYNALFGEPLNSQRAAVGLPPVDNVRAHVLTDHPRLADQQALFGRVAAVVHHGGAGITTTAARAGAPQVVVAQWGDQPYWAARVADLAIGTAHDGLVPTAESLSAALEPALTPQVRARATAVASRIGTDGAMAAAKLLLDLAS